MSPGYFITHVADSCPKTTHPRHHPPQRFRQAVSLPISPSCLVTHAPGLFSYPCRQAAPRHRPGPPLGSLCRQSATRVRPRGLPLDKPESAFTRESFYQGHNAQSFPPEISVEPSGCLNCASLYQIGFVASSGIDSTARTLRNLVSDILRPYRDSIPMATFPGPMSLLRTVAEILRLFRLNLKYQLITSVRS
jgi:hypothetical protein